MQLTSAQIQQADNLEIGTSDWLPIDQERVNGFAEVTEDRQWIHLDQERAKQTPFGGTIAHGFLTVSLIPHLFSQVAQFPPCEMVVNYGLERLRFIQPVVVGDALRLRVWLISGKERSRGLMVRFRCDLELKSSGRRAAAGEILFLLVGLRDMTPQATQ